MREVSANVYSRKKNKKQKEQMNSHVQFTELTSSKKANHLEMVSYVLATVVRFIK